MTSLPSFAVNSRRLAGITRLFALACAAGALLAAAPSAQAQFADDFARPDGAALGNGWIEKSPQAFSIAGGTAAKQFTGSAYRDNLVYRPAAEDLLDVEVAVELSLSDAQPGYPQLLSRVQSASVAQPNTLDGYILYVNNSPTEAILGRQTGQLFVTALATLNIAPGLNTTDTYRLRLRATGIGPVQLEAYVERRNGAAWEIIGQATVSDTSAAAYTTAGSVGFGGYVEANYAYDNFSASDAGSGSNPPPVLGSLSPASATEGGSAFSLTVNGSGFIPGSVVRWNGGDRTTTYVSPTELAAAVTAADIAAAGSAAVTVFTPAPGGGTSAPQTFTIDPVIGDNPVPVLVSLAPSSATEGGAGFSLTANGSDFVPGSVLRWNGADRPTTFVSAGELIADIAAADIAAAGTASVTVVSPAPGGGASAPQTFTIDPGAPGNPPPVLTAIAPSSATEGGSAFSLTVTGSDFVPGAVVRWNGADRATTYVSASELAAAITAADIAAAGSAELRVFNPAPGGGLSGPQTFTINPAASGNPVPVLTSLDPNAATEGDSAFSLTVNGSDFIPGSVVRWNGSDRATTFVSANELAAAITAADLAAAGTASVSVFTPAPGGGASATQAFTVQSAGGQFFDPFTRPDAADLGNGWIEKNPQAFALAGGAATKLGTGLGYRDNIAFRPAAEDLLDAEASIEIRLSDASPGYPQIFTRVQTATVGQANTLDGYILYLNNSTAAAVLGRQSGAGFVAPLATLNLAPAMNTSDTYRLRLRTTGSGPVQLAGFVERWNGSGWDVIGQATTSDGAAAAHTTAGSVGFGGYVEASYEFDNFTTTDLGDGSNPLPVLTSLNPASAVEGSSAFSLTVNGSAFIPGSVVRWNGSDRVTTYVSPTQLSAAITAADIAAAGSASVTVYSPAPGGGVSGARSFTIDPTGGGDNPVPVLAALAPTAATEGDPGFSLTVTGSDFVPGSVVRWNGADRMTTYVSAGELQAAVTAGDLAVAGSAAITVFNPAPGGGTSGSQTFTVNPAVVDNPVAVLAALSPSSAVEGGPAFTLTVTGSDFVPGSVVRWNSSDRATTYISASEVRATITAADIASAGSAGVRAFNPEPGGGPSNILAFTIDPAGPPVPPPVIDSTSPESAISGSSGIQVTILGNEFNSQSVANWNGAPRPTTFLSAQALEMTLNASDLASQGVNTVTVENTDAPGNVSAPMPFFVLDAATTYFFDSFNAPDSPNLGNGWTEKTPEVFSIVDGAVRSIWFDRQYRDSIAYRPVAEDRRDVEMSAEFVRQPAGQFTQLHARATRSTVATPDWLESYIFYVEDNVASGAMAIAINPPIVSSGECIIDQVNLLEPLRVGDRYRMTFTITGEDPVRLEGRVEWFNNGVWQPFFETTVFHDDTTVPPGYYCQPGYMPSPLTGAGATGFSKWVDQADDYDNYYWIDLSGATGTPSITSATPATVTVGGPDFTLIVDGANFAPGSVVQWNGAARTTTYVDSTTLQATIPAADIAVETAATVTVSTPPPGGGVSNGVTVSVVPEGQAPNPTPVLSAVAPGTAAVGQGDTQMTITGSGFIAGSVVRWNGADRATSFVSAGELTATIPAADLAAAGTAVVSVFNPAPGGGYSAPRSFAIVAPGDFTDDFARGDSADPQNGWTEKNAAAFSIVGGALDKNATGLGYLDNVVYRPVAETRDDVTTSVELQLTSGAPGYPQIFARLQPGSVATSGTLDGYILYINNGNSAILGRQVGSSFVETLATIGLSEALAIGETYRLTLGVSGSTTVDLSGAVERLSPTGFVTLGQAGVQDTSPQRIAAPGMSGISGYVEGAYVYDNFRDSNQN